MLGFGHGVRGREAWRDRWRGVRRQPGAHARHGLRPGGVMSMQQLLTIFLTVFLAELGDKTQLATLLFAADRNQHPLAVFVAAAGALMLSTAVAVAAGSAAQEHLSALPLKLIAGLGFVAIGLWTLYDHFAAIS
jgi:putative Ca2+/H+ antiporter (TMEM165/GDT1 family)